MSDSYIAVSGNIACGKSSLVLPLGSQLSLTPWLEDPYRNPWFSAAYGEPRRWSLALESHFLCRSTLEALAAGGLVQERFPDEHVQVFGKARFALGQLDQDELELLVSQLGLARKASRRPDVVVWLTAEPPDLLDRIADRGRSEERSITAEFLALLDELYAGFFASWKECPVIRVDTSVEDPRLPETAARIANSIHELTRERDGEPA